MYGEELQNGFAMMAVYSLFGVTQAEEIGFWMISVPVLCSALYVKFPSLQKILDKDSLTEGENPE